MALGGSGKAEAGGLLLCRAGGRLCALPVDRVIETMRPLPVEPLEGLPPFVLGVALIRGVATPVVDPSVLLGGASEPAKRFVTVRAGARAVGLAFTEVLGLRAVGTELPAELPPLLQELDDSVLAALGTLDAELLTVLESARLVPEAIWDALERAREAP